MSFDVAGGKEKREFVSLPEELPGPSYRIVPQLGKSRLLRKSNSSSSWSFQINLGQNIHLYSTHFVSSEDTASRIECQPIVLIEPIVMF